jgi:hypothetical protein
MNGEDRFDFYANAVSVMTSLYDVTLNFRTQSPVSIEEGRPPVVEVSGTCNVRMSPQHAKSLAALLVKHIIDYEERHSLELPIPPEIQESWRECVKGRRE